MKNPAAPRSFALRAIPVALALGFSVAHAAQITGGSASASTVLLGTNGQASVDVEFNIAFQPQDGANCAARLLLGSSPLEDITILKTAPKVARSVTLKAPGKQTIVFAGIQYGTVPPCGGSKQVDVQVQGPTAPPLTRGPAITPPAAALTPPPKVTAPASTVSSPPTVQNPVVTPPTAALTPPTHIQSAPQIANLTTITGLRLPQRPLHPEDQLEIRFEGSGPGSCFFYFSVSGPGNVKATPSSFEVGPINASRSFHSLAIIGEKYFPVGKYFLNLKTSPVNPSCRLDGIKTQTFVVEAGGSKVTTAFGSGNPKGTHTITGVVAPAEWYPKWGGQQTYSMRIEGTPGQQASCRLEYALINMQDGQKVNTGNVVIDALPFLFKGYLGQTFLTAGKWRFVVSPSGYTDIPSCYFPNSKVAAEMMLSDADMNHSASTNTGVTMARILELKVKPKTVSFAKLDATPIDYFVQTNPYPTDGKKSLGQWCGVTIEIHRIGTPEYHRKATILSRESDNRSDLKKIMAEFGGFKIGSYRIRAQSSPLNAGLGDSDLGCLGQGSDTLTIVK